MYVFIDEKMTKTSSPYGRKLNDEEKKLVEQLRQRVKGEMNAKYDTDYNLYRWILNAQKTTKSKDVINVAEKALKHHLRFRAVYDLDNTKIPTWEQNPMYRDGFFPRGPLMDKCDKQNRLLWFVQNGTINIESMVRVLKSSDLHQYYFWQFEEMLRLVNEQEVKTGKMSGVRHVLDLSGYEINPFTMLFVSNGSLAYYGNMFHYEQYPELVSLIHIVNASKWITVPYKLIRGVMPHGFSDRFQLHDHHFIDELLKDIPIDYLPDFLGGRNTNLNTIPARVIPEEEYHKWDPSEKSDLEHLHVGTRRQNIIPIEVTKAGTHISWYFTTDADVNFGIYMSENMELMNKKSLNTEVMEMAYPWLKLCARLMPESGRIMCKKPGIFYLVFCNKNAWVTRRNVHLKLEVESQACKLDRTFSM